MIATYADAMLGLVDWTREAGWAGVGGFALVFVVATLVFVPASMLTAGCGFLFGPLWGVVLMSSVGVLTAMLAFLLGRTVLRPWVQRRLERCPRCAAVDEAIGKNGFKVIFLLRLTSVIPFAPLSYALGVSRVPLRDFIVASWLGMLPGTVLYVYLGSLVTGVRELLSGGHISAEGWGTALYWGGLPGALVAVAVVVRIARSALKNAIGEEFRG